MAALASRLGEFLANPMMVKELRAGTRGARFLIAHQVILILYALVLLIVIGSFLTSARNLADPSVMGKGVFAIGQILQLVAVFLIVPAFGATTITAERERQTLDILMSTALTARQIAWGKFVAAMTQVMMIFVSLLPLTALGFFFGGVTAAQIIRGGIFLIVLASVLTVWSLSVSATARSTQRAVLGVYAGTFIVGLLFWALAAFLEDAGVLGHYAEAYGFIDSVAALSPWRFHPFDTFQQVWYVYVLPFGFAASAFAFFFLITVSRLQPTHEDRAAPFRIFYLAFAAFLIVGAWGPFSQELAGRGPTDRINAMGVFFTFFTVLVSFAAIFAAEDPVLPRFLVQRYATLPPGKRWRILLAPGARAGSWFSVLSGLAVALGLAMLMAPYTDDFDRGRWRSSPTIAPVVTAAAALVSWNFFCAGLARWLSSVFPGRRVLVRFLYAMSVTVLSIAPLVHWAAVVIVRVREPGMSEGAFEAGPVTLAACPFAPVWSCFTLETAEEDMPRLVDIMAGTLPLPVAFLMFTAGLGFFFWIRSERRIARLEKEAAA